MTTSNWGKSVSDEIHALEADLYEKSVKLAELKRTAEREAVDDHELYGPDGPVKLSDLFDGNKDLIVVHNMGKSCPYCTLWADGLNGSYEHLRDRAGFVVVSPDSVDVQQEFARSRGWRFPMYSGEGSSFIQDMGFMSTDGPYPGVSTFRKDNGQIYRVASAPFGPMDQFCSVWHLFALLAEGAGDWSPKYTY